MPKKIREKRKKNRLIKIESWRRNQMVYSKCSVHVVFCFRGVFGWICFVLICFVFLGFWLVYMYLPKGLGSGCDEQKNKSANFPRLPQISCSRSYKSCKLKILRSLMNLYCRANPSISKTYWFCVLNEGKWASKKKINVLVADSILIVSYHSSFSLTQWSVENNSCVLKVRQLWREGNALTSFFEH